MPTVWGYARVSREDQALALQLDALEAAGVPLANIVQEKESGARQRPAFDALLTKLQPGDSLVAWKVDRLGRDALAALTVARDLDARRVRIVITTLSVDSSTPAGHMVFGVLAQLAEFERATLIERTNAGLAAARKRGRHLGRRHSLTPHQQQEAKRMRGEDQTYAQIAALFGVSRSVVWRSVNTPTSTTSRADRITGAVGDH
jgi:DNA invertase Pin-like site-specific DNA recombinase